MYAVWKVKKLKSSFQKRKKKLKLVQTLPNIFQAAANFPMNDSTEMERLLMMAWLSRIPACMAMTTYFDAK